MVCSLVTLLYSTFAIWRFFLSFHPTCIYTCKHSTTDNCRLIFMPPSIRLCCLVFWSINIQILPYTISAASASLKVSKWDRKSKWQNKTVKSYWLTPVNSSAGSKIYVLPNYWLFVAKSICRQRNDDMDTIDMLESIHLWLGPCLFQNLFLSRMCVHTTHIIRYLLMFAYNARVDYLFFGCAMHSIPTKRWQMWSNICVSVAS